MNVVVETAWGSWGFPTSAVWLGVLSGGGRKKSRKKASGLIVTSSVQVIWYRTIIHGISCPHDKRQVSRPPAVSRTSKPYDSLDHGSRNPNEDVCHSFLDLNNMLLSHSNRSTRAARLWSPSAKILKLKRNLNSRQCQTMPSEDESAQECPDNL